MSIVLGIDLGTQQLKAVLYDLESRRVCGSAAAAIDIHQSDGGKAEQSADWWINSLQLAVSEIDRQLLNRVKAIGVSGQQHGFVPINQAGEVLAPVKLWCDTSTANECHDITSRVGSIYDCIQLAGNPILPGYTASKVLWFKNERPALYNEMTDILLPHDYLNFYLTGERCMEAGDASGTGFFDVKTRTWSAEMLAAMDDERDLQPCLPEVRVQNDVVGRILPSVAASLGLPEGIPVSIGGGDNMMGAIGTGNIVPGRLTISLGTSGTVYAYSDKPVIDPEGQIAAFCSSTGGWLPLLCTMNCTVSTELTRSLLNFGLEDFEASIGSASPGSGGIITLPFFNGERIPNLPNAKGCFLGVDAKNANPANFLRSSVEGATYALRFGLDELIRLGLDASEIVLIGGGANSATWRQIVADVFNLPVKILKQDEGAAMGAALQAAELICEQTLEQLTIEHLAEDESKSCVPRANEASFHGEAYQHYQNVVAAISPIYQS